ncbi:hypothetical protein SporoP37_00560 [Sporosarcina sp. P37]|nr:hypothetical protein SporoP37_00560 [Sporosarcina sp. P37]PID19671.1 hypothetical protein CSV62_03515 [Sporosarcina sp. P35]
MKYRFMTILHNLELDSSKNRGTQLSPRARITNGSRILEETLHDTLAMNVIGSYAINEFKGKTYLYIDGEFEGFSSWIGENEDRDREGARLAFYHLRSAQHFASLLWEVKDSNVYIRDGYLLVSTDHFTNGLVYKASLSGIFTKADGSYEPSIFIDKEISSAIKKYSPWPEDGSDYEDLKKASSEHFYKNSGSTRMERATYFTMNARLNSTIPMKILSYCTALECLFTTGTLEVSHKIAERVAVLLGTTGEEKKELFKAVKKAYGHRSTIVHGSSLKGSEDSLVELSIGLDEIMRGLLKEEHEVFSKKDNEIDDFFNDLLFTNTSKV